jgi:hypothetical protein
MSGASFRVIYSRESSIEALEPDHHRAFRPLHRVACQKGSRSVLLASVGRGHLTRRVFAAMLRRIWALPLSAG